MSKEKISIYLLLPFESQEICKPEVHFNNDNGDEQTNDIEITQPGFPRFTSDKEEEASRLGTNGHRNGHVN